MDKRSYFERWIPTLKEWASRVSFKTDMIDNNETTKEKLSMAIKNAVREVLLRHNDIRKETPDTIPRIQNVDDLADKVITSIMKQEDVKNIFIQTSQASKNFQALTNLRRQEKTADIWSKVSFLLFRILTALGLAILVLGTGYVAQKYSIPLPLLRLQ